MKNIIKVVLLVAVFGVLLAPNFSSASSVAELQAKINALMAQVKQLQAQLAQQQGTVQRWCYDFNRNLKIRDSGKAVISLHQALEKEGFGPFERGDNVFNIFTEETASAVTGFQEKYRNEILTPLGIKHGTGFVGKATRAKLNSLYGCGVVSKTPSIIHISPTFGRANDMIAIYGGGLVDTIPSGIIIEFLQRGIVKGTISSPIHTQPDGLSLRFQLSGLLVGNLGHGTYQIRVANDNGKSNVVDFNIVPARTPSINIPNQVQIPHQVQGLTANVSGNSVVLNWQAVLVGLGESPIGVYNIYRSTVSGFVPSLSNLIAQGNVLSHKDQNLIRTTYYYRVAAQDIRGVIGPASAEVKVVMLIPHQVQGLTANVSGNSVVLNWQAVLVGLGESPIGVYNIYRSTVSGFVPSLSNLIAQGNVLSHKDQNLIRTTYYYRVAAQDIRGVIGPASAEVKVVL